MTGEAAPLTFLCVATEWSSGRGGISTFNRELCCALARAGQKVFCLVPRASDDELRDAEARGVNIVAPTLVVGLSEQSLLCVALPAPREVDVVVGHGRITGPAALVQHGYLSNARYVHFLHMSSRTIDGHKAASSAEVTEQRTNDEVDLGSQADLVVAVGPELQKTFSIHFHARRRTVHAYLPGLSNPATWTQPPPAGLQCLLFGRGEDDELKGLVDAAEAMRVVCEEDAYRFVSFEVRGAPPQEADKLRDKLRGLAGGKVRLFVAPYSSDAAVIQASIRGASLVLMPSREEGFGLTGLEAISEGVPVLLSRTSGLAQALEAELGTLAAPHVVDVADGPERLAARIMEVLNDRSASFARVRQLRDAMRTTFSWDTSTAKLLELLRTSPTSGGEPPAAGSRPPPAVDASVSLLAKASAPVLRWPQTLGDSGTWIERPELQSLRSFALGESLSVKTTVLLGSPGSGKSALLARLAGELLAAGAAVLAIKADQLPHEVDDLTKLQHALELPFGILEVLSSVAKVRPTTVLIDQLDAVCDLMDLRSERLSVLLELVHRAAELPNVRIVLCCRAFEFKHDVRLRRIDTSELQLQPPSPEALNSALTSEGVASASVTGKLRELLQIPQHFDVFLKIRARRLDSPAPDSYQRMLAELWQQKVQVHGETIEESATQIAQEMANREELWVSTALLSTDVRNDVTELVRAGVLVFTADGTRVAFSHQTLFEFARSRTFAMGREDFSAYVTDRQNALFVRPTIWSTLTYLRDVDPITYLAHVERLWKSASTRRHVKSLLLEFMGSLEDPVEREVALVVPGLSDDDWRGAVLSAIEGRAAWFEAVRDVHLPPLMTGPHADLVTYFLAKSADSDSVGVLNLLRTYWLPDDTKHPLLGATLWRMNTWDEPIAETAGAIIEAGGIPHHLVDGLVRQSIRAAPAIAPRLAAIELNRQLATIKNKSPAPQPKIGAEGPETEPEPRRAFEELLDRAGGLLDLAEVARAAPAAFVRDIWPWFVEVVSLIAETDESGLVYRQDYSLATSPDASHSSSDLPSALALAMRHLARNDPAEFTRFVIEWRPQTAMAPHRFLCCALEAGLPATASLSFDYLTGDARRLVVGDHSQPDAYSRDLVAAVAPHLTAEQLERVEESVIASRCADEHDPKFDAELRRLLMDENRLHRLRLLKAIGTVRLSEFARSLIGAEQIRFPDADSARLRHRVSLGRQITADQMQLAKDEDLLGLFEQLPDSTGFEHPKRRLEGGSVQASQAFAELAKRDPERVSRLLPRFQPGRTERPVTAALAALPETLSLSRVEQIVLELHHRGFESNEFRSCAAYALESACHGDGEMSDEALSLVESWLRRVPSSPESEQPRKHINPRRRDQSVLWGMRGGDVLPGGNYPLLVAITAGCLARNPPLLERWLGVLERHVSRPEAPRVWQSFADRIQYVLEAPSDRAAELLQAIFSRFAVVRDCPEGASIIARSMFRLPADLIKSWMWATRTSDWSAGQQVFGELLVLMATKANAPPWAEAELETVLAGFEQSREADDITLGIGFAAAHLWGTPDRRQRVTTILLRLLPLATGDLAVALMKMFDAVDVLTADDATREVLESLAAHPRLMIASHSPWLVDRVKDLLPSQAELVTTVCLALVTEASASGQPQLFSSGPDLVDIALTLQRLSSPHRERGLDLFEALLRANAYGARDALDEIDERKPPGIRSRPTRRGRKPRTP